MVTPSSRESLGQQTRNTDYVITDVVGEIAAVATLLRNDLTQRVRLGSFFPKLRLLQRLQM